MRDFHLPGRSAVFAANAMCATSHPAASLLAIELMKAGGNAVDAAIGAAILQGLAEPQMTGIGGDCFALIKPADGEDVVTLNGSGRAPAALQAADLRDQGLTTIPGDHSAAITVPGAIDAFCRLSERYGKLGLDRILAPVIDIFENGLPVAPRVAFDWARHTDILRGAGRDHFLPGGKAPVVGQVTRAPGQAEVLRRIARDGRAGFYEGEIAEEMVAALRADGGVHTLDDFAATEATWGSPIEGSYKGVDLLEHPPNGHGATAILMANILAQFDLPALAPFGSARAHLEAEAAKLAYDTRNRIIADADHVTRLEHMLSLDTARQLAALIDPGKAIANATKVAESVHKETIYLTVVDSDRMVVSLIYSIYHDFGSGLATDKHGILFHNRGAGFTLEEGHPNELAGGKRPMHTIIPAMLRSGGRIEMPFGVMGGAYQPNGHARVLTNIVDYGLHPQAALDAPRSFATEGELRVERGYSDKVRQELSDLGHKVVIPETPIGGAQAIRINHETGVLEGASDPRKDGCALGY